MKEDYLWDKSGVDPEIERLENVLATFRYQETAAPTWPVVKATPFVEEAPRWNWSFGFAFAACAVVVILVTVWFQFLDSKEETVQDVALTTPTQNVDQKQAESTYSNLTDNTVETIKNTQLTANQSRASARHPAKLTNRRGSITAKKLTDKKSRVVLTKEEKYAYGQLMLALSITGSKLRVVSDTINRTEDDKPATRTFNR